MPIAPYSVQARSKRFSSQRWLFDAVIKLIGPNGIRAALPIWQTHAVPRLKSRSPDCVKLFKSTTICCLK